MADYDAIVIGAGHNGLTAAAIMARGGMRVVCLEKNQYVGGMASTNELIRGYRFELAVDRWRIRPGDLLEVTFGPAAPMLLLFVERVTPISGGVRVESAAIGSGGETTGAFWAQPPLGGSPATADEDLETTPPVAMAEAGRRRNLRP